MQSSGPFSDWGGSSEPREPGPPSYGLELILILATEHGELHTQAKKNDKHKIHIIISTIFKCIIYRQLLGSYRSCILIAFSLFSLGCSSFPFLHAEFFT